MASSKKAARGSPDAGATEDGPAASDQDADRLAAAKAEAESAKAEYASLRRETSLAAAKAEIASSKAEWAAFRREVEAAKQAVDSDRGPPPEPPAAPPVPEAPMPAPEAAVAPIHVNEGTEGLAVQAVASGPTIDAAEPSRGIPWLSNVGWVLAAVGLALAAYAYSWAVVNYPQDYEIGGIKGAFVGFVLAFVGLGVGFALRFVPSRPRAVPQQEPLVTVRRAQLVGWVGLGLMLLSLLLVGLVYRSHANAGRDSTALTALGADISYASLLGVFSSTAVLGLVLWVFGVSRAPSSAEMVRARAAAPAAEGEADHSGAPHPGDSSSNPGLGVSDEQVRAVMKKVDAMLATLPDDVVARFSKTPEADTYLKLLGEKRK